VVLPSLTQQDTLRFSVMHGGSDAVTERVPEAEMGMSAFRGTRRGSRTTTDLAGALVTDTRIPAEVLTIPQVADRLKVSRNTVYRLISAGELPVVEVRGKSRVAESDLQQYIDRNTRTVA
jgi:excisionase family DNA binding protein